MLSFYGRYSLLMIVVLSLSFGVSEVKAQADNYIFPDIAAPGMTTYFEIVASVAKGKNYFDNDGFYINSSSSKVRVEIISQQPAGIKIGQVGPIAVSWEGRLLSSTIFINPDVQPADWDWEKSGTYVILGVFVNNVKISEYRVDIVKPFPFGDKSGISETILGQGQLGKRSRRGAMIVDSMILANKVYTVSTNDPDASTAGNQAYLPFILISKGPIIGKGPITEINVNAVSIDGGPGGGGGAGAYSDVISTSGNGTNGGAGFTGGGPGGQNGSGLATNERKQAGIGSGSMFVDPLWGGMSINGVVGGSSTNAYETAGGGTGHPFGMSGEGCGDGAGCDPAGGYGAGSGYRQKQIGGSAGYATAGASSGGTSVNGGKVYGNNFGVPLAGGSGGAGGNPQSAFPAFTAHAGGGGGGGGAFRLQAENVKNVIIRANGSADPKGNGNGSVDPRGGGGSGGFIDFNTKLGFSAVNLETLGGGGGGKGRMRVNTNSNSGALPTVLNTSAGSFMQGFSVDTTMYLSKVLTKITGSAPFGVLSAKQMTIYLKHGDGDWSALGQPTNYDANGNWSYFIDLATYKKDITSNNKYFYLTCGVDVPSPSQVAYRFDPQVYFSQSASNVLIADLQPEIVTEKRKAKKIFVCNDELLQDTLWISNIGEGNLEVNLSNQMANSSSSGINFISPIGDKTLSPGDSLKLVFSFDPKGKNKGIYTDSLKIFTNEKSKGGIAYLVVAIDLDRYSAQTYDLGGKQIDTLNMGVICLGKVALKKFNLRNLTSVPITVSNFEFNKTKYTYDGFDLSNSVIGLINPNQNKELEVKFTKTVNVTFPNSIISLLYFYIPECAEPIDSLFVKLVVTETKLEVVSAAPTDFGELITGQSKTMTVKIKNNGPQDATLANNFTITPSSEFKIITTRPALPTTLKKDAEIEVDIEFTPNTEGDFSANFEFETVEDENLNTCFYRLSHAVIGKGIKSNFDYKPLVEMGLFYKCDDNKDTIITIVNKNAEKIKVSDVTVGSGDVNSFEASLVGDKNKEYALNDEISIKLTFKPQSAKVGLNSAKIKLNVLYIQTSAIESVVFSLEGKTEDDVTMVRENTLYFGIIPISVNSAPRKTMVYNKGELPRSYSYKQTDIDVTVSPAFFTIPPKDSVEISISINTSVEGMFSKQVVLVEEHCKKEQLIELYGEAAKSDITITPDNLNFGVKSPCMAGSMWVDVTNKGKVASTLVKAEILGVNANLFSIPTSAQNISIPAAGGNFRLDVDYTNPTKSKGSFSAELVITMLENSAEVVHNIPLTVEVKTGFAVSPNIIDFGSVVVKQTSTQNFTFEANSDWDIEVTNISFIPSPSEPAYQITASDLLNADLSQGKSFSWDIIFAPTVIGVYPEQKILVTYRMNHDLNCEETIELVINGTGAPAAKVFVGLDDFTFDPTSQEVKIPIKTKILSGILQLKQLSVDTLAISYNYSQFFPTKVENGDFISSIIADPTSKTATTFIKSNSFDLDTNESVNFSLIGTPMLGSVETADLIIENVVFNQENKISDKELENGSITTIVCKEGNNPRLLNNTSPMKLSVLASPTLIKFNCKTIEKGQHTVKIYNLSGQIIKEFLYEAQENGEEFEISVDSDQFVSGFYIIQFSSESRSKSVKISIVH